MSYVRRVAFDIGSITTKMIVADVDISKNSIVEILLKDVRKTEYKHDLERPESNGAISLEMIEKGIEALAQLKAEADALSHGPQQCAAVATAALRSAKNISSIIKIIKKRLGIPVYVISQEQEALLGFNGAITKTQYNRSYSLVWDIGGGSMQMTALIDKKIFIYDNEIGLINFSNQVMKKIQHKELAIHATPNPLSLNDEIEAVELASSLALSVPATIKKKISEIRTTVIGIGAIYYATHGTVKKNQELNSYTYKDVVSMLAKKINRTDEELLNETHRAIPVAVSITSLALISGFMKSLDIKSLVIVEVNLTDALIIDSTYYQNVF